MSVLLGKNKTVYIQTASTKMQVDNHVFYKNLSYGFQQKKEPEIIINFTLITLSTDCE